jgi:hypothetical protein
MLGLQYQTDFLLKFSGLKGGTNKLHSDKKNDLQFQASDEDTASW